MLERVRPETLGIHPASILRYLQAIEETGFVAHSVMLLRRGKVAFEVYYKPFRPDIPHMLCSCTKSVVSTAVGFAVSEGLLSLDDGIVDLLPEKLDGAPHPFTAAMTVRHLLTMTTAFQEFDPETDDWTHDFINRQPDHYPGTVFNYDSMGTHTLCEIVQKRSGMTLEAYLTPRLFAPLEIAADEIFWAKSKYGINMGGGGGEMTPGAMAKFGQLYLNQGIWDGRQVLPKGWAEEAAAGHVSCAACGGSFKHGYGYKFWRVQQNGFACLGLAGQAIVMHPDKDIVFVGTANGMQTDFHYFHSEYFWKLLYPDIEDDPVPMDDIGYAKLKDYIDRAEAFMPAGSREAPPHGRKWAGQYLSAVPNKLGLDGFRLMLCEDHGAVELYQGDCVRRVPFGYGTHIPGPPALMDFAQKSPSVFPDGCGSAGVWVDERTLVVHCQVINTLQYFVLTCHFGDEAIVLSVAPFGIHRFNDLPCALTHVIAP